MYIISADLGSSKSKAVVMKIEENVKEGNITLVGKVENNSIDFALFIYKVIDTFKINKEQVEVIVATGTGSSFLQDSFDGIKIVKVDEFDAIGYGGLILSGKQKGIVVSIGTGTAIIYSDMKESKRIGGTGLGGGTLVGLGNAILKNKKDVGDKLVSFKELIEMAKKGDKSNADLLISDINKCDIGNLTLDLTAANFAGVNKKSNADDYIAALVNMILENICLLVNVLKSNIDKENNLDIIFIGTMVTDSFIHSYINNISKFTKNKYTFIDNADYAIAIGAYEYYLLNIRENLR